jgi:hypothetical protein
MDVGGVGRVGTGTFGGCLVGSPASTMVAVVGHVLSEAA